MSNERGKHIDNTHLSIDQAEERGFIHRDYLAHCLRWSHVVKHLTRKPDQWRVLDVGCGREVPLAKTLYSSRLIVDSYLGVDYNELVPPEMFKTGKFPLQLFGKMDAGEVGFPDFVRAILQPNVIVCFEMLEHIEPEHVRRVLLNLLALSGGGAPVFLSTPCWDETVGAAANHVNEMTYSAFGALLEDLGFSILHVYGTFASLVDYEKLVVLKYGASGRKLFEELKAYYDVNYLSTVLAPVFPSQSRNCLWQVAAPGPMYLSYKRRFPQLGEVPGRWTSSERWQELNG
jgi:hypothetical protein